MGDAAAYNNMGIMLEEGFDDVMPDPQKAFENYKIAFYEKGDSNGLINMAISLLNNKFTEKDEKAATAYLK